MNGPLRDWLMRLLAAAFGAGIVMALSVDHAGRWLIAAYEQVGVTLVALAPLTAWAIWTALRPNGYSDLTLAYIGTTAQRVGLLGTVIGIVAATLRIGDSLTDGAASAVSGALPAVGQALVSTAVGFVIALGCDFLRYWQVRHANPETDDERSAL